MAKPSLHLIDALQQAASRLRNGAHYAWGHHGACNCGQLLQVITRLDESVILAHAHTGAGEWTEIAAESCAVTGAPFSLMLLALQDAGLTNTDIHHLEYLTDKEVLRHLPGGFRWLKRNVRQDVIEYFEAFAYVLQIQLEKQTALLAPAVSVRTRNRRPAPVMAS